MTGGCDSSWRTQPLAVTPDKNVVGRAQRAMNYCDRHLRQGRATDGEANLRQPISLQDEPNAKQL